MIDESNYNIYNNQLLNIIKNNSLEKYIDVSMIDTSNFKIILLSIIIIFSNVILLKINYFITDIISAWICRFSYKIFMAYEKESATFKYKFR